MEMQLLSGKVSPLYSLLFFFPENAFHAIFWRWPTNLLLNLQLQNIQEAPAEIGVFPATSP
jgi:hypothetical protein